ncbi:MAG: GNAT family N-acetyltransferase [Bacilli bacterium]|jgi:predicted acetyltransferase|nr:GNAT family N-acetyltransferase [Bacilli bacterium]
MIKLIKPTKKYAKDIFCYKQEMIAHGDPLNGVRSIENFEDYEDWEKYLLEVESLKAIDYGREIVRTSQYFLVRQKDDKVVATVDIRHLLSDFLLACGGNIGYSVRPCERKKGYAKLALKLALEECKKIGLTKVLVTTDYDNHGSIRTILANGGVFENQVYCEKYGIDIRRYWIYL